MNIILFGPPGAGKGTQSKYLVNKLNAFQISTGDLLREEIKKNSEIGKAITNDMSNGKFISDDIVNKLIENLISDPQKKNKLIFDGYPRSLSQAKNLEVLLKNSNQSIDLILFLNVDKETILKRLEKRKIIENILTKLTTIGALYLTLVCLMPEFLIANYPIPFYLGGASILIVVVVAIDTVTQIQTRLMSSQYEQLIKKTKFGK